MAAPLWQSVKVPLSVFMGCPHKQPVISKRQAGRSAVSNRRRAIKLVKTERFRYNKRIALTLISLIRELSWTCGKEQRMKIEISAHQRSIFQRKLSYATMTGTELAAGGRQVG